MQRAIHNHKGDVYDPFVGSGTTVIAGEQEGRIVYAIEIEPAYVGRDGAAVGRLHRSESNTEAINAMAGKYRTKVPRPPSRKRKPSVRPVPP